MSDTASKWEHFWWAFVIVVLTIAGIAAEEIYDPYDENDIVEQ